MSLSPFLPPPVILLIGDNRTLKRKHVSVSHSTSFHQWKPITVQHFSIKTRWESSSDTVHKAITANKSPLRKTTLKGKPFFGGFIHSKTRYLSIHRVTVHRRNWPTSRHANTTDCGKKESVFFNATRRRRTVSDDCRTERERELKWPAPACGTHQNVPHLEDIKIKHRKHIQLSCSFLFWYIIC